MSHWKEDSDIIIHLCHLSGNKAPPPPGPVPLCRLNRCHQSQDDHRVSPLKACLRHTQGQGQERGAKTKWGPRGN